MPDTIVDATTAQHAHGGIGVVIRGLLEGIQSLGLGEDVVVLRGPGVEIPNGIRSLTTSLAASRAGRLAYQRLLVAADRRLGRLGASRLIAMDSYVPLLPVPGVRERACFVHDVLPITHPQYFGRSNLVPKRIGLASTKWASAVFTSSDYTAEQIQTHVGVRARVVRFGCGQLSDAQADALLSGPRLSRRGYYLYVGAIEERKDLKTLLRAFSGTYEQQSGAPTLVIIGDWRTPEGLAFRRWAKGVAGDRVRFLGRLPPSDTWELIRGASALVYPSLAEGFGLPVLEGLAAGTPVVASDIPEIRTWARDSCIYFSPGDPDALVAALHEASGESGQIAADRGRTLSESYRWRSFAADLLAA